MSDLASRQAEAPVPLRRRVERAWEFGRRLRPSQVGRRLVLNAQRRALVVLGPRLITPSAPLPLAAVLPQPLFPPRTGMLERTGRGWRFTFLYRTLEFPALIPWSLPEAGPRDQLWKMNLHYMEYLEEVDDATFAELVADWIARNRPYAPGYWRDVWNSYTLSLRAVVWMQQLACRRGRLPTPFAERVAASLAEQIRFLVWHLETDLGGNHLVKNIKALLWAGAFFAGPEADAWRRLGSRLLARELPEQILPDGVHYERSPSYQCQVMADLLECWSVLPTSSLRDRLAEALHRMAQATADLCHPDGYVALFNDSGLTMAYRPGVCLEVYAHLLGREVSPRRHILLPNAGYYGYRDGGLYFLADCGPIGPDHLPAHGHSDMLSFELSVGGRRIIVDPGVYEYSAGPARDASRSVRSHNTVSIGDHEPNDFFGSFRCGRRATATVSRCDCLPDGLVLEGSHDGFIHMPGQPVHRRRFELASGRLAIHDVVIPDPGFPAQLGFLVHPDVKVVLGTASVSFASDVISMILSADRRLNIASAHWWPDHGSEVSSCRLSVSFLNRAETVLLMAGRCNAGMAAA